MREQEADGLAVVRTSAGLGKCGADVNGVDLVANFLLVLVGDGVRDDNTAKAAVVHVLNGLTRENAVHNNGVDLLGTVLHHSVGGLDEGSASVRHIVHNDSDLVFHVSDKNHSRDFVGPSTLLVNQSELQIQAIGDAGGTVNMERNQSAIGPSYIAGSNIVFPYRLAPPASGLTMTQLFTSRCSRIHFSMLGSAYKLSTGTLKKPWI